MGSDLFQARVIDRKGPVVRVAYEIIHPDVDAIEDAKNMALQTLTDSYWKCREGYLWSAPAAVRKRAEELAAKHPRKQQLDRWLQMAHGEEVEITPEQFELLRNASNEASSGPRYSSWGQSNDRYTATLATDYLGFMRESDVAIVSVSLEAEVNHPRGADDENPTATMVITVADGLVLHHLFKGLVWESRIYDFTGYA